MLEINLRFHVIHFQGLANATPERLFKVVFVGDSGVGKSSFMHQFCKREFRATFAATIGRCPLCLCVILFQKVAGIARIEIRNC